MGRRNGNISVIRNLRRFTSLQRTQSFSSEEYQVRRELAICHRLVAHYGMDELTWNHISARVGNQGQWLVTPGNKHFSLIEPNDLVLMGADDNELKNVTAGVIHGAIFSARCVCVPIYLHDLSLPHQTLTHSLTHSLSLTHT